jgi:two-component system, cell cycle sensor histidine kinase and response regulator CckA
MLTLHGFDVFAVPDGQAAIDTYRRSSIMGQPFDLVILDLDVRGGMGGRECISRLRGEFTDVKAILSTGYVDDILLDTYQEHGFAGVVTKPFQIERLISAVTKLMPQNRNLGR